MKVLVITYDFFPDNTPNTYRWHNILKKWDERGIEIFVISNKKNDFKESEIHDNLKIYRTSEFLLGKYKNRFSNKLEQKSTNTNKFSIKFRKAIKFIYKISWSNIYWPDFAILWTFSTYKIAKKIIKDEQIDKLITVSWPFSTHLIGYNLKKKFNYIDWLAETIDPFNFFNGANNKFIYNHLNLFAERKLFDYANHLTVTTDNIKNKYITLYPEIEGKIHVIKNLFVPPIITNSNIINRNGNKLKLSFFGSLLIDVRTPDLVIKFFKKIITNNNYKNIELHFFGEVNELIQNFEPVKKFIGKNIFLHGLIPREQVKSEIEHSDILINIGNKNEFQEPSKLIEYMFYEKPIINFTEIINDTSNHLLKNYPKLFQVTPETINQETLIKDFDKFCLNKEIQINKDELNSILEAHLINNIEQSYFNILFNQNKPIYV